MNAKKVLASSRRSVSWVQRDKRRAKKVKKGAGSLPAIFLFWPSLPLPAPFFFYFFARRLSRCVQLTERLEEAKKVWENVTRTMLGCDF